MTKNLLKQIMIKEEVKKSKESKSQTVASDIDIQKLIDTINNGYIVKRVGKHQQKKTFAPSTIAYGHGECPRYWYLAFSGAMFEESNTAYGVANMTSGTMSHDRIQQALMDSGIAKIYKDDNNQDTTEFKVTYSDPPIFGWGDAMLNWEQKEIVAEIKTMPNDPFEYFKNSGKPKKGHLIQLLIYMKILDKANGMLIYENKNNHELIVFPVSVNDTYRQWIDYLFGWMREVRKAWVDKTLPKKNYRSNAKVCKTCPVKNTCLEAGDGIIKIASLEELSETM